MAQVKTKKTRSLKIPEQQAAKVLRDVVKFLNQGNEYAAQLVWDVLSALRGPDADESERLKLYTTGRLRAAVGLKERKSAAYTVNGDLSTPPEYPYLLKKADNHFRYHYLEAVSALRAMKFRDLEGSEHGN